MDSPLSGLAENAVERMRRAAEIAGEVASRYNGTLTSGEFAQKVLKILQEENGETEER